jgi:hypothetical protein
LDDPKACCIFHQCFCKAAVGEVRWKECVERREGRIGNNAMEAFALLLFSNNHKAWLCEEKLNHGDALSTEHDDDTGKKESMVDKLLEEQEFVLEGAAELEDMLVICDAKNTSYKKAVKEREEWIIDFKARPVCGEMLRSWTESACATRENAENESSNELPNKKERDKKKRKAMKGHKKWTGAADETERKFKGWPDNGHKAFKRHTHDIKADVEGGKCALWEKVFRKISATQREARLIDDQPSVLKHSVNRSAVWELQ